MRYVIFKDDRPDEDFMFCKLYSEDIGMDMEDEVGHNWDVDSLIDDYEVLVLEGEIK